MKDSEALVHAENSWEFTVNLLVDAIREDREAVKQFVVPHLERMKPQLIEQTADVLVEKTAVGRRPEALPKVILCRLVNVTPWIYKPSPTKNSWS